MSNDTAPINDGGPAFPGTRRQSIITEDGSFYDMDAPIAGITMRDYFAAAALQGWLGSFGPEAMHPVNANTAPSIAREAYAMADAMLAERNRK